MPGMCGCKVLLVFWKEQHCLSQQQRCSGMASWATVMADGFQGDPIPEHHRGCLKHVLGMLLNCKMMLVFLHMYSAQAESVSHR